VRSNKKFGLNQFSCFDVYRLQTDKDTKKQSMDFLDKEERSLTNV